MNSARAIRVLSPVCILKQNNSVLYVTGNENETGWKKKEIKSDFYYLKEVTERIFRLLGLKADEYLLSANPKLETGLLAKIKGEDVMEAGIVNKKVLNIFSIKQETLFAVLNWQLLSGLAEKNKIEFSELSKFPAVQRDLAIVVPKKIKYEDVKNSITKTGLVTLREIQLFDIFESEKLGADKKSIAISLTFFDEEKPSRTKKSIAG